MIAGLPGVGLSGLFVLLSALGAPIIELARPQRGRVGRGRVAALFGLSIVMVLGLVGAWNALVLVARLLGHPAHHPSGPSFTPVASVPVVVVSLCIVLAIVAAAEVALHVVRPQLTPTPPPLPFYGDTLALDGAVLEYRRNSQLTSSEAISSAPG